MCGRFVLASPTINLVTLFDVQFVGEELPQPSWNIAPTQQVPVIIDAPDRASQKRDNTDRESTDRESTDRESAEQEPVRRLESARWGLVPSWAKDVSIGSKAFNARVETAAEKPMFRSSVASRRAIIPADGYYEWHTTAIGKTPIFIHPAAGELIAFAALYSWWRDPNRSTDSDAGWLLSATILTRASVGPLADIHDRMPVFLDDELLGDWLDPRQRGSAHLLDAVSGAAVGVAASMTHHPVGREVGSVRNNGSSLIEPTEG
jgi:putative SOS response-associated peptidase YedK